MRRFGVAAAVLLLAVPVGAETLEGEGFRLEVPEGFVRADAQDEADVRRSLVHTYRAATPRKIRDDDVAVHVYLRPVGEEGEERLVVSRLAGPAPPADDPEFLRGQRNAFQRTVREISGTLVRVEAKRLLGGLLVAEGLLEGEVPGIGPGTIHSLVLPRESFLVSIVFTQRTEPARDPEAAWGRMLASLRSDARPPRSQERESPAFRAGYVVGQILAVLLLVLLVRWIVRRVRRAGRQVDAEAEGPADGPGSGPDPGS